MPTFAFQTAWLYRMSHNSPLDRFAVSNADDRFANLQPQLEMTLAVLDRLMLYPSRKIPPCGGDAQAAGRLRRVRPAPRAGPGVGPDRRDGSARDAAPPRAGRRVGRQAAADVHLRQQQRRGLPRRSASAGERGYLPWPLAPHRTAAPRAAGLHVRRAADARRAGLPHQRPVHRHVPASRSTCWAMPCDDQGRILYATDYGVHGDGNPAFQCTDSESQVLGPVRPGHALPLRQRRAVRPARHRAAGV